MSPFGKTYNLKVAILMATFFYACDDGREAVINERQIVGEPAAVAFEVRMVYTDSMRVKAILTAAEHHDFTNLSLKHSTFPKGLKVVFLDEAEKENIILADYGILYNNTGIIDLQGNVMLKEVTAAHLKPHNSIGMPMLNGFSLRRPLISQVQNMM